MEKNKIQELTKNILHCLEENNVKKLREISEDNYPADIAEALEELENKYILIALRLFSTEISGEIFTFLDTEIQEEVVKQFSSKQIKELFEEIYTDDVVEILEEMPSNIAKKILRSASRESRMQINEILKYEEYSAGSIMNVEYTKLRMNWTVEKAIETIKAERDKTEEVYDFFVVDELNNLKGFVELKELFFSKPEQLVKDVMDDRIIYSYTKTDQEEVTEKFKKYDITTLPILNSQNKLVGIITVDDIIDVIEEEATEDIQKMAGISPTEDEYFKTSVWKMVRSRTLWLLILMLSATLTQIVIILFMKKYNIDTKVSSANGTWNITYIVTMLLMPLITVISGTSGNAASQTSTMVVRSLSLKEVEAKDFFKILWKELRVAFFVGLILILVNFVRMIVIYSVEYKGNINRQELWHTIATITIAMFLTLMVSKTLGVLLPIFAKKIKLDPAIMAAPLLTTLVDALATAIFFSVGLIFFMPQISV